MRFNSICCHLLLCFISFGSVFVQPQQTAPPAATPTRLSLEMAKEILMARNPTLLRERQNIAVARGALVEAKKIPNPEFELSSESYPLFESNPGPFINNSETILRASQTIETAGKRGKRTAVASQDVRVSESSLQDISRQLQLELKRRYFAVSLAKAQYDLAQQILSEYDKVVRINEARYKQGEVSGFEFSRLQTERLRFFSDVIDSELQLKNSKAALLELLGADPGMTDFDVTDTLGSGPLSLSLPDLQEQALQARADLAAQRQRVDRGSREVTFQKSQAIPNITPAFGYKRTFNQNTVAFGVNIPLPLFNRNQGGVAQASAQLEQQRYEQTRVELEVRSDVQQAFNSVQAQNQRVEALQKTYVPSAQRERDIAESSYRLGALELISFLDVQRSYREALRSYNQALFDQRAAVSLLEAAIGKDLPK
jgi:cobalt-zinc-cadmium efflux system outer membrane protein